MRLAIAFVAFCAIAQMMTVHALDDDVVADMNRDMERARHRASIEEKIRERSGRARERDRHADRHHEMDFDVNRPEIHRDEILRKHRSRYPDDHHDRGRGPNFDQERHNKFLDMNRKRGDRLKRGVIEAKFGPKEEAALLAKIEQYHDLEFEQATYNHENKQKKRDEYGAMSKEAREVYREKERAERFKIRDMRLEIEEAIRKKTQGEDL